MHPVGRVKSQYTIHRLQRSRLITSVVCTIVDRNMSKQGKTDEEDDSNEILGGLFSIKTPGKNLNNTILHQRDCTREQSCVKYSNEEDLQMLYESIKNCFVSRNSSGDQKLAGDELSEDGTNM